MRKQTKLIVALSATALLAIGASAVAMADGWDNSSGDWRYLDRNGNSVTDVWRKSGDFWFYLGSDGRMVREELIDYKDNYYYVNADGAMVTNTWVPLNVDDSNSDAEYRWYYFGSDGKAYKNSSSTLHAKDIKTINGKKYAFDEDGQMLYGWVSSDLDISSNDDEDWQTDEYYFGGWNDGSAQAGWVQLTVNIEGISEDDDEGTYWFYFDSNGKKKSNKKFAVDGKTYYFDYYGRMIEDWVDSTATGDDVDKYVQLGDDRTYLKAKTTTSDIIYTNGDGSVRKNAWVWAIPSEAQDSGDNDDDEYSWWYAEASGKIKKNGIKKINGKYYVFDKIGRMKSGLVITFGTDAQYATNNIITYTKGTALSNTITGAADQDLTEYTASKYLALGLDEIKYAIDEDHGETVTIPQVDGYADYNIYYFSGNGETDGSKKTGYQNVEFDDGVYQMYFNTSSGKAENGYVTKIKKFVSRGIVLKANVDDSNYGAVEARILGSGNNSVELILAYDSDAPDADEYIPDVSYDYEGVADANIARYRDFLRRHPADRPSGVTENEMLTSMRKLGELRYVGSYTEDRREGENLQYSYPGYSNEDYGYGYYLLVNSSGAIQRKKTNLKDNNDIYYFTDDYGVIVYAGSNKLKVASGTYGKDYGDGDVVIVYNGKDYVYD